MNDTVRKPCATMGSKRAAHGSVPVAGVARPQVLGSRPLATVATGKFSSVARLEGRCRLSVVLLVVLFLTTSASAADTIEFLSGAKVTGKMQKIRKDKREFDFEAKIGSRTLTRTYKFSKVHAVTMNGKRYVLTPKPESNASDGKGATRTKAEIIRLIDESGTTPPDWFDAMPLDHPPSLDLSWPLKSPKGWNNKKNVGQYIWDVINPNPSRWRSGIRLIHHLMPRHASNRILLQRDMKSLGTMYFNLFQDYPRAAFWFRRAKVTASNGTGVMLAECYWRLGNKKMAMDMLQGRIHPRSIKLLGDMGETQRAVQMADLAVRSWAKSNPNQLPTLNLMAADALRLAGQYQRAIRYYQKVLKGPKAENTDYDRRFRDRANQAIQAIRLYDQVVVSKVADGTYKASSMGYVGPVEVEVKVAAGRLESVKVVQHKEKQFYAALTDIPNKLIQKQSITGIDATTSATITSEAIIAASAKALAKGAR